jgi:alkylation response protein AidB-like acyl-CoA dehydrogenase
MSVNNSLVCAGLEKYCNEEQNKISCSLQRRSNWCFLFIRAEAGSDATCKKTTAIDKGDHYLLNGTKIGLQMDPRLLRTLSRKRILKRA